MPASIPSRSKRSLPSSRNAALVSSLNWRQHAHSHQIAAMDAFETLRDDGFHTEQTGSFAAQSRELPVPYPDRRRSPAARFQTDNASRIVDAHAFAVRLINRDAAFNSRHHQVLDPDVCEGAAYHDFVIATPRAVTVEVFDIDAALLQVQACRVTKA